MTSRKNLVISFILSFAIYMVITFLLEATMITSFLGPVWRIFGLTLLVPWMAFQMAYGVGPACFPMVPTCLVQDIMLFVQAMLPVSIVWPNSLQIVPGCASNASLSSSSPCLKSCRSEPFYYTSWESSVAWATCNVLVKDCELITMPDIVRSFTQLPQAFANHSEVVHKASNNATFMDIWHGHQFCFFITLGQLLPYILILVGMAYAAVQLLMFPVILFSAAMQFAWQAVAYTHLDT